MKKLFLSLILFFCFSTLNIPVFANQSDYDICIADGNNHENCVDLLEDEPKKEEKESPSASKPEATEVKEKVDRRIPLSKSGYDTIMTSNKVIDILNLFEKHSEDFLKPALSNKGGLLRTANHVLATIGILWLVILGFKFAVSQGNEEKISKYKQQFGWVALGLAIISVAEYAAFSVFDPTTEVIGDPTATNAFAAKINQIKIFFQIVATAIAVATGALAGYNLITGSTEDEAITNEKRFVHAFFFGVAFLFLSEVIVRVVSLQYADGKINPMGAAAQGVQELTGILNFGLTFLGGASVFMLILASFYYVSSFGNEDQANRAKQIIISCIVGIVVILSSYTIINYFVK